jgi:hypothetical protein
MAWEIRFKDKEHEEGYKKLIIRAEVKNGIRRGYHCFMYLHYLQKLENT